MTTPSQPINSGFGSSIRILNSSMTAGKSIQSASVAELVMRAARSCPEAPALSAGPKVMTYGDLAERSMRLAKYLRGLGARPEIPIALCLDRSFDFIISAIAVISSGAAYLPLDPTWPAARLRMIVDDAQARLVISRGTVATSQLGDGAHTIDLDTATAAIESCEMLAEPVSVGRDNLAYIIYTSGSTGRPNGVELTHGNLLNLISWHRTNFGITPADRASHVAGLGFDAAVWEIWPHLAAGATLVLVNEQARTSADLLSDWLVKERITIAFVPTILAEPMLTKSWPSQTALRYLLTGGETLHRHSRPELPFTVVNNYGPTECTVVATSGTLSTTGSPELLPPIGRPIANTQVHILDPNGHPVAQGQVGELYISGHNVGRGYRNRPNLTAERFRLDSSNNNPHSRMYKTGDMGCFLPDGQIAFRGRLDTQEQIRGHRVETDEIVCALNRHPAIAGCAVVMRCDDSTQNLVAYVVPRGSTTPSSSILREFLGATLPSYMVPSVFVQIPALPTNSNGKLDRSALPAPDAGNRIKDVDYRPPSTPTEEQLVQILTKLLKVEQVGADDNFFLLGFDSLLATQVTARIQERFGIQLGLRHLFEAKTVARLAVEVDQQLIAKVDSMTPEEIARQLAT
jgi:amino acid adenylation domain-containing protein